MPVHLPHQSIYRRGYSGRIIGCFPRSVNIPYRAASRLSACFFATPLGGITYKHAVRKVDFPRDADNRKSRAVLGLKWQPQQESVQDMFQKMIDSGEIAEAGNAPASIANPVAWIAMPVWSKHPFSQNPRIGCVRNGLQQNRRVCTTFMHTISVWEDLCCRKSIFTRAASWRPLFFCLLGFQREICAEMCERGMPLLNTYAK